MGVALEEYKRADDCLRQTNATYAGVKWDPKACEGLENHANSYGGAKVWEFAMGTLTEQTKFGLVKLVFLKP